MRKDFCEATAKFEIDFSKPIDIKCPVRIVHAIKVTIFISKFTLFVIQSQ